MTAGPHQFSLVCDRVIESLSARLDGEAPVLGAAEVDDHLRTCRRCRDAAGAFARLAPIRAAGAVGDSTDLPPALRSALHAASAGQHRQMRLRRRVQSGRPVLAVVVPAAVAAAAALILAVPVAAGPPARPPTIATPCTSHLPAACRQGRCTPDEPLASR